MELVKETGKDFQWLTEVPSAKLFAAIKQGEALTSMYLRVNDQVSINSEEYDVLEDPLIRCLFEGVVGGYQSYQLSELR